MAPVKTTRPVLPGEIYRSNDLRDVNRLLRVLTVSRETVFVQKVERFGEAYVPVGGARETRIRRSAFHSKAQRGYTLIESPIPARSIAVTIDGADDLIAQRLLLALEQEATDFAAHHSRVSIIVDGAHQIEVVGTRRFDG